MSSRGHMPYEGRGIQAPGTMRHGPFPAGPHHPLDPLPPPELLENKIAAQAVEIERLLRENQRLAATNVEMRQELGATEQEMQTIKSHIASIQTESGIQARGLVEKIRKLEEDIHAGEAVQKELQQAHMELQNLLAKREELNREIQLITEEMQKASGDSKKLPEFVAELDGLRQEHQKLRAAFEYEKGLNIEQVEQMRSMEKNLISLAREVEKLRADIVNAEKGERTASPYGTYGSVDPLYGQGGSYSHGYVGGYANAGYGHGSPGSYAQAHGRVQPQITGGTPPRAGTGYPDAYLRQQHTQLTSARTGYSDVYGRLQVPVAGASEGVNPRTGAAAGVNPLDAARGGSIP